jgi:uncharacterized membrane protein YvbJ
LVETDVFCPNCGKKISSENNFCINCGTKLANLVTDVQKETNHEPPIIHTPRRKSNTKKIIAIAVIGLVISSFGYIWMTEISPEIQRINKINQQIEEQNQQVIRDRGFGDYDCYYNEAQKVNNCIPRHPINAP